MGYTDDEIIGGGSLREAFKSFSSKISSIIGESKLVPNATAANRFLTTKYNSTTRKYEPQWEAFTSNSGSTGQILAKTSTGRQWVAKPSYSRGKDLLPSIADTSYPKVLTMPAGSSTWNYSNGTHVPYTSTAGKVLKSTATGIPEWGYISSLPTSSSSTNGKFLQSTSSSAVWKKINNTISADCFLKKLVKGSDNWTVYMAGTILSTIEETIDIYFAAAWYYDTNTKEPYTSTFKKIKVGSLDSSNDYRIQLENIAPNLTIPLTDIDENKQIIGLQLHTENSLGIYTLINLFLPNIPNSSSGSRELPVAPGENYFLTSMSAAENYAPAWTNNFGSNIGKNGQVLSKTDTGMEWIDLPTGNNEKTYEQADVVRWKIGYGENSSLSINTIPFIPRINLIVDTTTNKITFPKGVYLIRFWTEDLQYGINKPKIPTVEDTDIFYIPMWDQTGISGGFISIQDITLIPQYDSLTSYWTSSTPPIPGKADMSIKIRWASNWTLWTFDSERKIFPANIICSRYDWNAAIKADTNNTYNLKTILLSFSAIRIG